MAGPHHSLGMDEPCGVCGVSYRRHGIPLPPPVPEFWQFSDHGWTAPAARVQLAGTPVVAREDEWGGEESWGRVCECGHTIGEHTFAGKCTECGCEAEHPRPAQVRLDGLPLAET